MQAISDEQPKETEPIELGHHDDDDEEHDLFIWRMRALEANLVSYVIAMNDSQVRDALKNQVLDGQQNPLTWVVDNVVPLDFCPHVICVSAGTTPDLDEKPEVV